ncbi:MAG: DUF4124 domain-containing protein [Halioglobus sp.]|nr:DUF4124 domain-containing protein [Halioglobus sp.]
MTRRKLSATCLLLLAWAMVSVPLAAAEVYRWVDEDGNVHFGDKPRAGAGAEKARAVAIDEAYKPPERSAEELRELERERQQQWRDNSERMREEQAARDEAQAQRRQQEAQACERLRREVAELSGMSYDANGRPFYYYVTEDGKSVSSERQREMVAERRAQMQRLGC